MSRFSIEGWVATAAPLAALGLALFVGSCAQVLGIEEITPRGTGGAAGATCTGGDQQCADDNPCTDDFCDPNVHRCIHNPLDGPAQEQTTGDCQQVQCEAGVPEVVEDPADPPDDDNQCTVGQCAGTTPQIVPHERGTECDQGGGVLCDGDGSCRREDGAPCTSPVECFSTYCADETCCETPCADPCYRCDAGSSIGAGQCAPGVPRCNCAEQYEPEPDFSLCLETVDDCAVSATLSGSGDSCAALCERHGGECYAASIIDTTPCMEGAGAGCEDTGHGSLICLCSRGCGAGPRCPDGQACSSGTCVP